MGREEDWTAFLKSLVISISTSRILVRLILLIEDLERWWHSCWVGWLRSIREGVGGRGLRSSWFFDGGKYGFFGLGAGFSVSTGGRLR